ncbi:MAG: hypothetical protein ACHQ1H_07635 [Nitrososphaerales archaeon]
MNPFAIIAAIAVAVVALAEIMVARQKAQMKKEFIQELDKQDSGD